MTLMKSALTASTMLATLCLGVAIAPNWPRATKIPYSQAALGQNIPRSWEIAQEYQPPNRGAPAATSGGASRGDCLENGEKLTSLMPSNNLALTTAEYPTFFWYLPKSSAQTMEFKLLDGKNGQVIYRKSLPVPSQLGVVSFTIPKNELTEPLEVGKMYHWFFTVVCPANPAEDLPENSGNAIVDGWVERTEASPTLLKQLEKAKPSDRPALYAAAGIWHDSLTSLAQLRSLDPNDQNLAIQWGKLLKSVGLDEIADKPTIECCTANM